MHVPKARLTHQSPGRLRFRVPSKKGDSSFFDRLARELAEHSAVDDVQVNHRTAGALVLHRSNLQSIVEHAAENGLFLLSEELPGSPDLFRSVSGGLTAANEKTRRFTRGEVDLLSLVFFLLIIVGLIQVIRGGFKSPPWYTAFWYALGIFGKAKLDEWGAAADVSDDGGE